MSVDPEKATFGMGCFWHPDEYFSKLPGVTNTVVGYSGGAKEHPTYNQVCEGGTGHSEVVEIEFDPSRISYNQLLEHFWQQHNPTVEEKTQYQSVIFYHDKEQKTAAEKSKAAQEKKLGKKIVTKILPLSVFHKAEEYHQKYLSKNS